MALHIDFETRSPVDLKKAGAYRYAEHPHTGIWCMAWALNESERRLWLEGQPVPEAIVSWVRRGGMVVAHNAPFERTIWNTVLRRIHPDLPLLTIAQMDCTMARCASVAIPGGLGDAAHILGTTNRKDDDGRANMLVLAKPVPRSPPDNPQWNLDAARHQKLRDYCLQDVATEAEIAGRVPELSARERRVWELDQRINDRGVRVDVPTVRRALAVVAEASTQIGHDLATATGGIVTAPTQVQRLVGWLKERELPATSLGKEHFPGLRRAAVEACDPAAVWALDLRRQGAKSSTAKLKTMLECVCADDRARGLLAYHGASTGRWAGRLIQPQNLYRTDPDEDGDSIVTAIAVLQSGDAPAQQARAIEALTGTRPMEMIAKCLRSMFIAAPGKRFIGCDLSNIEGRLAAWAAGEHWKVQAFRDYDEGRGPDLYRVAYARSFGVADPSTVSGSRRQVGKVTELSLQYQGSVGAWLKMAANYGVRAADVVPIVHGAVSALAWAEALERYRTAANRYGLDADEWAAVSIIVKGWREAHPAIVGSWWELQDAAVAAVGSPGAVVPAMGGRVRYLFARDFLWCGLPSGRVIAYARPVLKQSNDQYVQMVDGTRVLISDLKEHELEEALSEGAEVLQARGRRRVDYEGFEGEKKRWATMSLYGGMQFNHIIQGTARDVLVEGMFDLEERGYPLVLTVHDENLAELPFGQGSAQEMAAIMSRVPSWVDGDLPLAAKAWEDVRYAK